MTLTALPEQQRRELDHVFAPDGEVVNAVGGDEGVAYAVLFKQHFCSEFVVNERITFAGVSQKDIFCISAIDTKDVSIAQDGRYHLAAPFFWRHFLERTARTRHNSVNLSPVYLPMSKRKEITINNNSGKAKRYVRRSSCPII